MDDVIDFPKSRVKPLSEEEALAYLRREGPIETTVTALAKVWGWERTKTSKVLSRWNAEGKIAREPGTNNRTVFSAVVAGAQADVAQTAHPAPHTEAQAAQLAQADVVQPAPPVLRADAQSAQPGAQSTPVERPSVLVWCRWILGGLFVLLSLALYGASLFLNATFWPGLAPTEDAKAILRVVGIIVETVNYTVPSAFSIALTMMSRALKRWLRGFWILTMITAAVAGASFMRDNLGAAATSRQETIDKRNRYQGIINSVVAPVSDTSVAAAQASVETAKANRKSDCPKNKSLDIEVCNRAKAALALAQADLKQASANHDADVKAAEQRHREDVTDAEAKLDGLPKISAEKNGVRAGIAAIVPWISISEDLANALVPDLWIILFAFGPCLLLWVGVDLLVPPRTKHE
jgi:hypothetical protein